jgi:hypothetical protein
MPMLGTFGLEVVEVEPASVTFRTRGDHPEAGRVTICAEPHGAGQDVRLSVRTRTRANGWRNRLMYIAGGQLLQARLWAALLERVAATVGSRVADGVHARTAALDSEPADLQPLPIPVAPLEGAR